MSHKMTEWLGIVSMVCFTGCYAPQLLRTYRTRNVDGVSTAYWMVVILGYVSGLGYIVPLHDRWLLLTYGMGLGCAFAMAVGCLVFRRR